MYRRWCPPPHGEIIPNQGEDHVEAYTDGSCPNNRAISASNPAGWGYNYKHISQTIWAKKTYGPVNTAPDNPAAAGATVGSNNTAEVQALIELLDDILLSLPTDTAVIIYTDSQYAHDAMRGLSVPATHTYMIRTLQKLYAAAKQRLRPSTQKVAGHSNNPGNDVADDLADSGAQGRKTRVGRHAENPPRPITIPPRPLDPQWLNPLNPQPTNCSSPANNYHSLRS